MIGSVVAKANSDIVPKFISKPVFCEALLRTGANVASDNNPLVSLRDAKYALQKAFRIKASDLDGGEAYGVQDFFVDLRDVDLTSWTKREVRYVLDRLEQLESDTLEMSGKSFSVGYEFRGYQQVKKARDLMLQEINEMNPKVLAELAKRYPKHRPAYLLRHVAPVVALGATFMALNDPSEAMQIFGAASIHPSLSLAYFNEVLVPLTQKSARVDYLESQLQVIDATLASSIAGQPISLLAGVVEIDTDLHKSLLNVDKGPLSAEDIQLLVNNSEDLVKVTFDRGYEARELREATRGMSARERREYKLEKRLRDILRSGEGPKRTVFFDSIFFVDPRTQEPVWLLYYRAFKQMPYKPKKPKVKAAPQTQRDEVWDSGLQPVPVGVRR